MSPARLVRRCTHPGCTRVALWPACVLHRTPEMGTAEAARLGLARAMARARPLLPFTVNTEPHGAGPCGEDQPGRRERNTEC